MFIEVEDYVIVFDIDLIYFNFGFFVSKFFVNKFGDKVVIVFIFDKIC